jgi:DNA polymerase III gamma/tau subunit
MITQDEIIRYIKELSALAYNLKWATNQRVMLEVTVIKLCGSESHLDASISDRLSALEKRMDNGGSQHRCRAACCRYCAALLSSGMPICVSCRY